MTEANQYRVKAAEFDAMARREADGELRVEYTRMAQRYLRLARLADLNNQTDIVYETPPPDDVNPR